MARWRRWVYFDLSGGRTIERHAVERDLIGKEIAVEKLIFGSDCAADEVHEHVERFEAIFDSLGSVRGRAGPDLVSQRGRAFRRGGAGLGELGAVRSYSIDADRIWLQLAIDKTGTVE